MEPFQRSIDELSLPRPWLLYGVAATRLALLTKPPVYLRVDETRMRKKTGFDLARATSSLSQGRWLARLALLASQRCGGGPIKVLELGAAVGISGSYLLAGMAQGAGGHLVTCEGLPEIAAIAKETLSRFVARHRLSNVTYEVVLGRFETTFPPLVTPDKAPYHLVFVDGNHDEAATLEYHARAREVLHPRGLIAHDDIDWSEGMRRAWAAIAAQERDQAIIELDQGSRPSRGIIFYGEPPISPRPRYHLDPWPERLARKALHKLR